MSVYKQQIPTTLPLKAYFIRLTHIIGRWESGRQRPCFRAWRTFCVEPRSRRLKGEETKLACLGEGRKGGAGQRKAWTKSRRREKEVREMPRKGGRTGGEEGLGGSKEGRNRGGENERKGWMWGERRGSSFHLSPQEVCGLNASLTILSQAAGVWVCAEHTAAWSAGE